jgi:hypothetical protein
VIRCLMLQGAFRRSCCVCRANKCTRMPCFMRPLPVNQVMGIRSCNCERRHHPSATHHGEQGRSLDIESRPTHATSSTSLMHGRRGHQCVFLAAFGAGHLRRAA